MPCFERERKKFEVVRNETQQLRQRGEIPYDKQDEKRKAIEELYARMKQKLDEHQKALERLKKRLREATSQQERDQIEKEIAELEKELAGMHDTLEDMVEFMRDLERRTISLPAKEDKE
jgi:hypothetical protein